MMQRLVIALSLLLLSQPASARPRRDQGHQAELGEARATALELALANRIGELARANLEASGIVDATIEVGRVELSEVAAPDATVTSLVLSSKGRPVGWVTARARVARGNTTRDVWVKAQVVVLVPTVVATRALARGTVLVEGDMRVEARPLSDERIASGAMLVGSEVRQALAPDEPLRSRDLASPQLVRRGEVVTVVVVGESFEIKASGEALEGGGRGDEITLRLATGQRQVVRGIVTDTRRVELR